MSNGTASSLICHLVRVLAGALLVLVFALAARHRFELPLTPLSDPDVWCYFNPGLSRLLGGPFQHTYGQCFLYPGLIYVVLAAGGDFRWITLVQHLLGLGTGALLLVAWYQVRCFLPTSRLPRFLFGAAGLGMAGIYLLSTTPIRYEHTLRPEAVYPFFCVLNICCSLAFIRGRFVLPDAGGARWTLAAGAGTVITCVMAWLLKPSFSAMLLLANLPVILSLFLPGGSRRDKTALVLLPTVTAGLLLILPEWQLRKGDLDASSFLATSLFTVHADLIRDQMADDLANGRAAPYDPCWLATVQTRLTREIEASSGPGSYPSLGFNPDSVKQRLSFIGVEGMTDFCDEYYWRVWHRHPRMMLRKIWRQMGIFYRFEECPAYKIYPRYDLKAAYAGCEPSFSPGGFRRDWSHPKPGSKFAQACRYPPAREYFAQCVRLAQSPDHVIKSPDWVAAAAERLSGTYFALCLGAIALGATASGFAALRRWYGPIAGVLLLLYSYNFGTTLSLSIGHSMDVDRYSTYQLVYTLLPQCVSLWLVLEAALAVVAWQVARCTPMLSARCGDAFPAWARRRRLRRRWFVLTRSWYPFRWLGMASAICLLLAVALAASALHHRPHAHRRYTVHRATAVIAGVLTVVALGGFATGFVLTTKRRR